MTSLQRRPDDPSGGATGACVSAPSLRACLLRVGLCMSLLTLGAVVLELVRGQHSSITDGFAGLMLLPGIVVMGGFEMCGTCSPPASTAMQAARMLGWGAASIVLWTLVGGALLFAATRAFAAWQLARADGA